MGGDAPRELLQEQFDSMMKAAMVGEIGAAQYIDMRRSFFAGAAALFNLQMSMLDAGDEPTEMDMSMMEGLRGELMAFNEAVKRREK